MLDIAFIRDHTDVVKESMKNKGEKNVEAVDELLRVDENGVQRFTR